MLPSVTEEKAALRRTVRRWLAALPSSERRESDRALFAHFLSLPQVEGAKTIFAFWGIPEREPDTGELVRRLAERGKVVGLPRMLPGRGMEVRGYASDRPLVPAAFGLLEPDEQAPLLERAAIDLILVPGLCYDREATAWASAAATMTGWLGRLLRVEWWGCAGPLSCRTVCLGDLMISRWTWWSPRRSACPTFLRAKSGG